MRRHESPRPFDGAPKLAMSHRDTKTASVSSSATDASRQDDGSYWARSSHELRQRLASVLPQETLKSLHRPNPWLHFLVLGWQFLLLASSAFGAFTLDAVYLWLPCSVVLGFTLFNFTVMLHEVVHEAVFEGRRATANRWLGYLYAFPSGISASQFTKWHLDHHAQLGDAEADPKRHYLSPKRRARWLKLLYMTPR